MEQALIQVGLPVTCAYGDCGAETFVKPATDHDGWYKSKFFQRRPRQRWYCPKHYQKGREIDNKFFQNVRVPDPYSEKELKSMEKTQDELYKLLD